MSGATTTVPADLRDEFVRLARLAVAEVDPACEIRIDDDGHGWSSPGHAHVGRRACALAAKALGLSLMLVCDGHARRDDCQRFTPDDVLRGMRCREAAA